MYHAKSPHPEYVKCFLLAKLGRGTEALDAMEKMKSSYCAYDHKYEPLFTQLVSIIKKTSPWSLVVSSFVFALGRLFLFLLFQQGL